MEQQKAAIYRAAVAHIDKTFENIEKLNQLVGFEEEFALKRFSVFVEYIEDTCRRAVESDDADYKTHVEDNSGLMTLIIDLENELEVQEGKAETKINESMSCFQIREILLPIFKQLSDAKAEKMKVFREMLEEEYDLCKLLGREKLPIPDSRIPTETQMKELAKQIKFLQMEQEIRKKKFFALLENLQTARKKLGESAPAPRCPEDQALSDGNIVSLSDYAFKKYEAYCAAMGAAVEKQKAEIENMKVRVHYLWTRMKVEDYHRRLISRQMAEEPAIIGRIHHSLQTELQRLEEMKERNLPAMIEAAKEELRKYWELLKLPEDERNLASEPFPTSESNSSASYKNLQTELQRLEEMKERNLPAMIEAAKEDEAFMTLEEFDGLLLSLDRSLGKDVCSEAYLDTVEIEVETAKAEYADREEVLKAFDASLLEAVFYRLNLRSRLLGLAMFLAPPRDDFLLFLAFDHSASCCILNQLPAVEERLVKLITDWEARHHYTKCFKVNGQPLLELLKRQKLEMDHKKRKAATAPSVSPTKKMKSVFSAANLVFPSPLSTNHPNPPFLTSTRINDERARSPEKRDARPTP
ncbi:unnamed protein product [Cyprideis torosa]|uniref:Uncharacterized protein n=1 Tax=Cyprideis torosa TaxID=163714 RepID=A0A7R8WD02_9CRUS|nr:unnamed protein product [Cyprideis torosa]CAG0894018.1 unnamed protein product [Cyprideis torosa]